MEDRHLVPMGKIVGAHGRTGTLKVFSYAESPDIFDQDTPVYLKSPRGDTKEWYVSWVKPHHRHLLISIKGVNDRNAAGLLKAFEILIHRDQLPELTDGTYYWCDLIGIEVTDTKGEYMGIIERIIDTGANDVYVVKNEKKEILIPAVAAVIERIDIENQRMRVNYSDVN